MSTPVPSRGTGPRSLAPRRHDSGPDARRELRRAWWSLALVPAAFMLATLVGEGLLSLLGHGTDTGAGTEKVPLGVVLLAGGPALLVLLTPTVAATWFGRRARRLGARAGRAPAALGLLLTVAMLALNVAAYLWG